jgi:hypothetical protein
MANVITDWRGALIDQLASSFPAAEVKPGRRQGVSRDKDRIHVFADPWTRDAAREVIARPVMLIRYWKKRDKLPTPEAPADPEELEQAALDLLDALRPIQALPTLERPWYFTVETVRVDEDPEEWGVEARLVAFTANEATIA